MQLQGTNVPITFDTVECFVAFINVDVDDGDGDVDVDDLCI